MRHLGSVSTVLVASLIATACTVGREPRDRDDDGAVTIEGSDAGPSDDPRELPNPCSGDTHTTARGVVRFPNGELPVASAVVYVLQGESADPDMVPHTGECGECIDASGLSSYAVTRADGSFTLRDLPAGTHTLVVEKGRFRRVSRIEVTACETTEVPAESTRLPRNATEGRIPRLAVIGGAYDHMESVVERLGLDEAAFERFGTSYFGDDWSGGDGDGPSMGDLLTNRERLMAFDILLVNCGAAFASDAGVLRNEAVLQNLRDFVEGGGRLYATDQSYDIVEAPLPRFVDFIGGTGDGLGATPERIDDAQQGNSPFDVNASVHDESLAAWLKVSGATTMPGRMHVEGFLGGWAVIDRVDPERTKVWVSGEIEYVLPGRDTIVRESHPMTVSFEHGCGRALFTSYHTHGESYGAALTPQEKALAYLLLEVGACIEEPMLF